MDAATMTDGPMKVIAVTQAGGTGDFFAELLLFLALMVVMADPFERHGRRVLLNLGHTFGHALEAIGGYDGRLLHGEAVAIGMRWAFDYAVRAGVCPAADAAAVQAHMDRLDLPAAPPFPVTADELLDYMAGDKKNAGDGAITLILPRGVGDAFVAKDIPAADIAAFLQDVLLQRS